MSSSLHISISNDAWQNHLLSSLRNLRECNRFCNATLITQDGETSRAHAIMLAASSPVLYSLLTGGGPEYTVKLLQVSNRKVLQFILDFIYEGQITLPIKLLKDVQGAAEKLRIDQLSDVCSAILEEMGIKTKQDASLNTAPPVPPSKPKSVQNCVLKVPSLTNPTYTSRKPSLPVPSDSEQAIDLSIVKTETENDRSYCNDPLPLTKTVREESREKRESQPKLHVPVPLKEVNMQENENKQEETKRKTLPPIEHGVGLPYQSFRPLGESALHMNIENKSVTLLHAEDAPLKLDNIPDPKGQPTPPQDEDDELIEEMVAEQLLQSRMQRSLGKQPKGMKRFHCRICDSRFTRLDNLRVHIRSIHTGKKPFKCNVCDKTFTRAFTLKYHKMSHDGVKPWTCSDCGRGFTRKDYHQEHIQRQICKKNKTQMSTVGSHVKPDSRTSSPVQEDTHQCQICDAFFPSQDTLENHMEDCMNDTPKWESKNHDMSLEQDQEDTECICDVCHTHFLDRDSLFVHQMEHKRQEESLKIEMIAPDAPDGSPCKISRQDEQNLESIKKEMSSRSLNDSDSEDSHLKSNPKKRQLPSSLRELLCEEEDRISSHLSPTLPLTNQCNILDLRKNSMHSDENENLTHDLNLSMQNYDSMLPLKKQKLSESFSCSQENLDSLLSLAKKPLGFLNCFNETDENTSMNLLNEMRDGSGLPEYPPRKRMKHEQPYSCDICQARFTRGDNMRVHRRRHFNTSKMFTCPECGQAFTRSSSLKTHMSAAHKID